MNGSKYSDRIVAPERLNLPWQQIFAITYWLESHSYVFTIAPPHFSCSRAWLIIYHGPSWSPWNRSHFIGSMNFFSLSRQRPVVPLVHLLIVIHIWNEWFWTMFIWEWLLSQRKVFFEPHSHSIGVTRRSRKHHELYSTLQTSRMHTPRIVIRPPPLRGPCSFRTTLCLPAGIKMHINIEYIV